MKKTLKTAISLFILIILFASANLNAQTKGDFYWKGDATNDNISEADNWHTAGSPSSGDNLYFNSTNTRHWAYCNYAGGAWFGNIVSYNGAGGIKWYGDKTYAYKFENNGDPNLLEIEAQIENRGGSDLEINPVGLGGILINNLSNVNLFDAKQLKVYGDNTLTIDAVISQSGTGNSSMGIYGNAYVKLNNANTFQGGLFSVNGTTEVNYVGSNPLNSSIFLGETSGVNNAILQIGTDAVNISNLLTIRSGSSGIKYLKYTPTSGTGTFSGAVVLNDNTIIDVANGGTLIFSNTISDIGSVEKTGDGIVILSANNTYSGITKITAGTIELGISGEISNSSNMVLNLNWHFLLLTMKNKFVCY